MAFSGVRLFLGGELGQFEILSNLFGILALQIEGNLQTAKVQKWTNAHKIGRRQYAKECFVGRHALGKLIVPFLRHHLQK